MVGWMPHQVNFSAVAFLSWAAGLGERRDEEKGVKKEENIVYVRLKRRILCMFFMKE